ncbi:NFACT RNA binding domain-containing protein [Megalodesulfovibrio paquesii]
MDASFFRCLIRGLPDLFHGALIRKVFGPADGVFVLAFDRGGLASSLVLRVGRREPWLFPSVATPPNPPSPSALVMWLRRQLQGRRCMEFLADWPNRSLAIRLGPDAGEGWCVLDLRHGIFLMLDPQEPPEQWTIPPQSGFVPPAAMPAWGREPLWPSLADVLHEPDIWRTFPQISPPLRRMLLALPEEVAAPVYATVQTGGCGAFYLYDAAGPFVWADPTAETPPQVFTSAAEAAAEGGRLSVLPAVVTAQHKSETDAANARRKRLTRNLKSLEQEERRLEGLLAQRDEALLLQANLFALNSQDKCKVLKLQDADGVERLLTLDPRLTIAENMARRFRQAAKAERGLEIATLRRATLEAERAQILATGELPATSPRPAAAPEPPARRGRKAQQKVDAGGFRVFRSSDGFRILQGKNARANHALVTREANPFDYWLHAADGPGSHVLIKRDHAGQEVPRRTIEEAAILAALRSWQAGEGKGRVMLALARDVRPVKGGPPGMVHVDKMVETVQVRIEQGLESILQAG